MPKAKVDIFRTSGKVLTLTVGIPSSGKTTWALGAGFDVAVSLDDCREALWGSSYIQNGLGGLPIVLVMQEQIIKHAIAEKRSIVVHDTHIERNHRLPLIQLARKYGYRVQIVYFDVPHGRCLERNRCRINPVPRDIINRGIKRLEVPDASEADLTIQYSELCRTKSAGGFMPVSF